MKSILSISALIVFLYIQLYNGMVFMSYELNKSSIIEQFCINKDKPEMKCEGTCHMKKMMLSEDTEKEGEPQMVLPEIQLYVNHIGIDLEKTEIEQIIESGYLNNYSFYFLNERDIPPKV